MERAMSGPKNKAANNSEARQGEANNSEAKNAVFNAGFPIHWWHGKTGRVYPHSVFPLGAVPWVPEANYVLTALGPNGSYEPIYIGATENLAETLHTSSVIPHALRLGATHIHIHLLGESPQRRLEIRQDVRDASRMALNPDQAWLAAS
jgi:hypothetical protein